MRLYREDPGDFIVVDSGNFFICIDKIDSPGRKKSNVHISFKVVDMDSTSAFLENNKEEFRRTNERNAETIIAFDPDGNELPFVKGP